MRNDKQYLKASTLDPLPDIKILVSPKTIGIVTHQAKRDLMRIAKSIDPGQPAQSTQAVHGRNFSLLADFLCVK